MTENAAPQDSAPQDSALRPAESDLHPADPTDDLTANTTGGTDALPGDATPGDGAVAHDPPDEPDAMRTAAYGREAAAARADTSDERPTPTATPAD